jgi:NADH-quinone oxidoreductase subunit J
MILLVAMVGAIVLTHRHRKGARKQRIHEQVNRRDSIKIVKVETGKGI